MLIPSTPPALSSSAVHTMTRSTPFRFIRVAGRPRKMSITQGLTLVHFEVNVSTFFVM